jgi:hypothetical protein
MRQIAYFLTLVSWCTAYAKPHHLWDYIFSFGLEQFDYYDNSIKMIGILILSGNYQGPHQ